MFMSAIETDTFYMPGLKTMEPTCEDRGICGFMNCRRVKHALGVQR